MAAILPLHAVYPYADGASGPPTDHTHALTSLEGSTDVNNGVLVGVGGVIAVILSALIAAYVSRRNGAESNKAQRDDTDAQRLATLYSTVDRYGARLDDMQQRLDAYATENLKLRAEVTQLNSQLDLIKAERDQYQRELTALRRDNAALEERLQTAQNRIYNLQDAYTSVRLKLNILESAAGQPLTTDMLLLGNTAPATTPLSPASTSTSAPVAQPARSQAAGAALLADTPPAPASGPDAPLSNADSQLLAVPSAVAPNVPNVPNVPKRRKRASQPRASASDAHPQA